MVEEHQPELAEAVRVADDLHHSDPLPCKCKAKDDARLAAWSPHCPHCAINERRLGKAGTPDKGAGYGGRTAHLARGACLNGCVVGAHHDLWVEQRKQGGKVAIACGSEEGGDYLALAVKLAPPTGGAFGGRVSFVLTPLLCGVTAIGNAGRALQAAAGAAGELPGRNRRAPDNGSDLLKGHGEEVVQHKGQPFGGRECFEHYKQGKAN